MMGVQKSLELLQLVPFDGADQQGPKKWHPVFLPATSQHVQLARLYRSAPTFEDFAESLLP